MLTRIVEELSVESQHTTVHAGECGDRNMTPSVDSLQKGPFRDDRDPRKTPAVDIVADLKDYGASVDIYDPWVSKKESEHEYGITPIDSLKENHYDAVILAVAHREFIEMGAEKIRALCKPEGILYDVKNILPKAAVDGRL